jgi:hypothetical protein
MPVERLRREEQERYLNLRLYTAGGDHFVGQYVEEDGRLVYASLSARRQWLQTALAQRPLAS